MKCDFRVESLNLSIVLTVSWWAFRVVQIAGLWLRCKESELATTVIGKDIGVNVFYLLNDVSEWGLCVECAGTFPRVFNPLTGLVVTGLRPWSRTVQGTSIAAPSTNMICTGVWLFCSITTSIHRPNTIHRWRK